MAARIATQHQSVQICSKPKTAVTVACKPLVVASPNGKRNQILVREYDDL